MAVEGDLKDLGLASLIQAMCLDRREAIVFLKRGSQDGIIAFKEGEVIHAAAGKLVGEQAVFALLHWTEGSFRLSDGATSPARTISTNWNKLLLQGMQQIDEQEAPPADTVQLHVLTDAETEEDRSRESSLLLLLSKQEQMQMRLVGKESLKYALQTLQIVSEMVNQVAIAAEEIYGVASSKLTLAQVLAEVSQDYPHLRLLRIQGNSISIPTVHKLYGSWSSDPAGRRETFHGIACGMVRVVEVYALRFLALFHAPSVAAQCGEATKLFLSDWSRIVEELQF